MDKDKVLIHPYELKRLRACEKTLYSLHRDIELCHVCEKGMLCDGFICPHCGYDYSCSAEEWEQTHAY